MDEPQTAERSLILDFVSPLSVMTFFKSMRTPGCSAVALSTGGGLILKLITVLSTGLFVLQSTKINNPTEVMTLTDFGGKNSTSFHPGSVDRRPVSRIYAIGNYNLPYPSGTYEQYAYQTFTSKSKLQVRNGYLDAYILKDSKPPPT